MFSIVFLQIKAKTKISSTKDEKDFRMGAFVVATIFASAFIFYLLFLIGTIATENEETNKRMLVLGVYNSIVSMPSAFTHRHSFNFFDISYILTFCMMIAQGIVML